ALLLLLLAPKSLILFAPVFFGQVVQYSQAHFTLFTAFDILWKPALCLFVWGIYKSIPRKQKFSNYNL
ncbi:MAG: hypothetical protein ACK55Z_32650, partial [bacterium]